MKANKTTLITDMSNAEYHDQSAFSSSQIKDILRTPAHFYTKHLGKTTKKAPSADMLLGSVVHTLLLENDKFATEYAISQKFDKRTKQGKVDAEKFEQENMGKTIIDQDIYDTALQMAKSLGQHNVAKLLKTNHAIAEASIFYTDVETGLDCRIRLDFHIPPCDIFPNGLIVDLKTTDNASSGQFARTIYNFGYHISAAMYQDGFVQHYQTNEPPPFIWLVAEREAPYAVIAYNPDHETLHKGHDKKSQALQMLAQCLQENHFPAYSSDILTISLPNWA